MHLLSSHVALSMQFSHTIMKDDGIAEHYTINKLAFVALLSIASIICIAFTFPFYASGMWTAVVAFLFCSNK